MAPGGCAGPPVLPLVPELLEALQEEMAQFQRLVTYWPQFGPALESSMCTVLRDATGATSRLCGLIQVLPVLRPRHSELLGRRRLLILAV